MRVCRYSSTIRNLATRWKWVVSFMTRPLFPWGNSSQNPLYMKLSRPRTGVARYEGEKNFLPVPGIELRLFSRPARNLVATLTAISQLPISRDTR
jgi:hypothetical protein